MISCLMHKKSFHPKHTFEGILKSQLIRFLTICNNMEDFHEATSILLKAHREKRHYSGRFLRQVKSRFLRNYRQLGNTLDPIGAALKCKSRRCQCCLYLDEKSHSSNDDSDVPIFGGLNCLSKNIIYIIECKACGDKYVGGTGRCLKDRILITYQISVEIKMVQYLGISIMLIIFASALKKIWFYIP